MTIDRPITTCKEVRRLSSTSLGVFLTKELRLAGIEEGDMVEITITKVKGGAR